MWRMALKRRQQQKQQKSTWGGLVRIQYICERTREPYLLASLRTAMATAIRLLKKISIRAMEASATPKHTPGQRKHLFTYAEVITVSHGLTFREVFGYAWSSFTFCLLLSLNLIPIHPIQIPILFK